MEWSVLTSKAALSLITRGSGIWGLWFLHFSETVSTVLNKSKIIFRNVGFHQCGFYFWLHMVCLHNRCEDFFLLELLRASGLQRGALELPGMSSPHLLHHPADKLKHLMYCSKNGI